MLSPEYLDRLPDNLVRLYAELELEIIMSMARRISEMNLFSASSEYQFKKLLEMGLLYDEIIKKMSRITGIRQAELKRLVTDAGITALDNDLPRYRQAGLSPTPLNASVALQETLQAGLDATNGIFDNLTRTTAQMATRQFEKVLDTAYMKVSTGAFDYNSAIQSAVKELASNGVGAVTYPTGYTSYIEPAVRRAVITGVNQAALRVQEKQMDEMGAELVEVTAHAGARVTPFEEPANHSYWQGGIYSRKGKHKKYPDLVEVTGYGTGEGLGGWNCRHSMYAFFEGISERAYTDEQLKEYNAPKYEYNGKKLTEYEARQQQRYFERQIRKWKREYKGMESAGQPTDEAAAKISYWQKEQEKFAQQTGLKRQYEREQIQENISKTIVKSSKDDIISENSKKPITKITENTINKVPKVKISGYTDEQNKYIQQQHKELLKFARDENESKETAFVLDGNLSNRKEYIGTEDRLDFGNALYGKNLFIMHNHPRNSSYSLSDIIEFVRNNSIKTITIVKNNGEVETITKIRKYSTISLLKELDRLKKNDIKMGLDSEYRKLIDKFLIKHGKDGTFEWLK